MTHDALDASPGLNVLSGGRMWADPHVAAALGASMDFIVYVYIIIVEPAVL